MAFIYLWLKNIFLSQYLYIVILCVKKSRVNWALNLTIMQKFQGDLGEVVLDVFASLSVSAIDLQVLAFGFADLLRWEFQHLLEPEQEEKRTYLEHFVQRVLHLDTYLFPHYSQTLLNDHLQLTSTSL